MKVQQDSIANVPPINVTIEEAAELLRICDKTVRELAHKQSFPSYKIGSRIMIPYDRLREWANAQPDM